MLRHIIRSPQNQNRKENFQGRDLNLATFRAAILHPGRCR